MRGGEADDALITPLITINPYDPAARAAAEVTRLARRDAALAALATATDAWVRAAERWAGGGDVTTADRLLEVLDLHRPALTGERVTCMSCLDAGLGCEAEPGAWPCATVATLTAERDG